MAPVVHGLEAEYYGKIKFTFLDVDDAANDEFKRILGYRGQPQFLLLDGKGEILQEWYGSTSVVSFRKAFEEHLKQ